MLGFPGGFACQFRRCGFDSWVWKIPWKRKWLPTPVFLSGKSHRQRSLTGYSPWGQPSDLAHTHARYIGSTSDHFWMKGFDCLVQKPQNEVGWHLCRGAGHPQEPWYTSQFGQFRLWVGALLLKVLDFSPFIKIKYFQCMFEIHFLLRRPHYSLTRSRWWGKINAVKLYKLGTFLVVQWLRSTCQFRGHRFDPCHVLQLLKSRHPRAHVLQKEKPPRWEALPSPLESSSCLPQLEKKPAQQQRLSAAKNKQIKYTNCSSTMFKTVFSLISN